MEYKQKETIDKVEKIVKVIETSEINGIVEIYSGHKQLCKIRMHCLQVQSVEILWHHR